MIEFRIDVADAAAHRYEVTLTLPQPDPEQILSLPVWIPGSYMVREFARHLHGFEARQGRAPRVVEPLDKTTWRVRCSGRGALVVRYAVYAFDTSVRTAFLDTRRGFFNGTSVCLRARGREQGRQRLRIGKLPAGWQVATAMPAVRTDAAGKGLYEAADYDELVDHPFELGTFWRGRFEAAGVPHEFVVAGAWPSFDGERLLKDTRRICEAEIALWHGRRRKAVPFDRYVFLLHAVDDGYGGLEHRASTALIAARRDLPRRGIDATPDGYVTLLGLVSHEYFHTWNVKRLKPREFTALDYTRENYTRLLWFFEGFTSYYDDLLLLRAGLIDPQRYLKLVARTIGGVLGTPGRRLQSVAESSFDAWVKYYRQDENTPNATISYYTKGALVGLCLDLSLRAAGAGTLDDVMRGLWKASGGGAIDEAAIADAVEAAAGPALRADLLRWVHGHDDLPLAELLATAGVRIVREPAAFAARLGLRVAEGPVTGIVVRSVLRGGPAERAGIAAGDEILAVDRYRVRKLDDALGWIDERRPFMLLIARDQRIDELRVDARGPAADGALGVVLELDREAPAGAVALRDGWLARPRSA